MNTEDLYRFFGKSKGVCTDTRIIKPGQIFIALKGPSFNGNAYAAEAIRKGAVVAIVDDVAFVKPTDDYIFVPDALAALQNLARQHRRQMNAEIIAITGTNGKTTSKELIAAVLGSRHSVLATQGNLNNHIGVPLTLLNLNASHAFGIIEMGANHRGEINQLCQIAQPDSGAITNIGKAHLEGFGSEETIQKTKGELYNYLAENEGKAFVNTDYAILKSLAAHVTDKCTYGIKNPADISGKQMMQDGFAGIAIEYDGQLLEISSQLTGSYNCENILLAATVGIKYGIAGEAIKSSIENYTPANHRSQLVNWRGNKVIMDAYNANPTSMKASIESFTALTAGRKVAIIGSMLELGPYSGTEHNAIAGLLKSVSIDTVLLVGDEFSQPAQTFGHSWFKDVAELNKWLQQHPLKDATILVKGSRSIGLERILD